MFVSVGPLLKRGEFGFGGKFVRTFWERKHSTIRPASQGSKEDIGRKSSVQYGWKWFVHYRHPYMHHIVPSLCVIRWM